MVISNVILDKTSYKSGDKMTITYTVKNDGTETITCLQATLCNAKNINLSREKSLDVSIAAGKTATVSVTESAYNLSARVLVADHLYVLDPINVQGANAAYTGDTVEVYMALNPAVSITAERYADGSPSDEGTDVYVTVTATAKTSTYWSNLCSGFCVTATSASGTTATVTIDTPLASGETVTATVSGISAGEDWDFVATFGDSYETVTMTADVARAFANVHLSGASTGGVCIGGFSTATEDNPKFESYYPAYLYGGVIAPDGWIESASYSGTRSSSNGGANFGPLTVAKSGVYLITLYTEIGGNSSGFRTLSLMTCAGGGTPAATGYMDRRAPAPTGSYASAIMLTVPLTLSEGDEVWARVQQNSGSTLSVSGKIVGVCLAQTE